MYRILNLNLVVQRKLASNINYNYKLLNPHYKWLMPIVGGLHSIKVVFSKCLLFTVF